MRRREFIAGLGAVASEAVCRSNPIYAQGASGVAHRTVDSNGIHLHFAEQGEGPLVILCHGFPESWYSWRHQLPALSAAGFHAVAVDMRGYGQSDRPEAIDQYTLLHLVGDMVGLLDALGVEQAVIRGTRLGCAARVARRFATPRSFPRSDRPKRSVPAAGYATTHLRHAATRGCSVLPALFSDTGSRRGRVRTRRTANLPQDIR